MADAQQTQIHSSENPRQGGEISISMCEICYEPISQSKEFKHPTSCSSSFCFDCISKHIEVKVEENTSEVKCPGWDCDKVLDPLSCRPMLRESVFDKWCDVKCEWAVLSWPRAYCPFRQCSEMVLNECGGSIRRCKCPNCKKLFCYQCQIAWHAGYQCNETSNVKDRNDVLFGQLVEDNGWTRCPGCNHSVELIQGCYAINCRCGTKFCYACGAKTSSQLCECRRRLPLRESWPGYLLLLILAILFLWLCYRFFNFA